MVRRLRLSQNLSRALLASVALLLVSAGCSQPVGTSAPPTPTTTASTDTEPSATAHPNVLYNFYYYFPVTVTPAPNATSPTSITSTYIAVGPPYAFPTADASSEPGVLRSLEDVGKLLLYEPHVNSLISYPQPNVAAELAAGLEGTVFVKFNYLVTIIVTPAGGSALGRISLTVKNSGNDTMITSVTFYFAYRDKDGAILKDGTVTVLTAARPTRAADYVLPTQSNWNIPMDTDIGSTTAEVKVLGITSVPSNMGLFN